MYQTQQKGKVTFQLKPSRSAAVAVQVAGSFNGWKPLAMKKRKDGAFFVQVPAAPGQHEYKFIIDGQWMIDPDHRETKPNPYGTANSVARV